MAIKAIFFDFGNTLVDEKVFSPAGDREAIREIIKIYRIDKNLSSCLPLAKMAWEEIEALGIDTFCDPQGEGEKIMRSFAEKLIKLLGKRPNKKAIHMVCQARLRGVAKSDSLFPHTQKILLILEKYYKLGIISNMMVEYVNEPLKYLKINDFFDVVVISGKEKVGKPNPEIFNIALKGFAIKPEEGAMVGDSLEEDIVGAHNVGMATVWINRSGRRPETGINADYVIRDIRGLLDIFKSK